MDPSYCENWHKISPSMDTNVILKTYTFLTLPAENVIKHLDILTMFYHIPCR